MPAPSSWSLRATVTTGAGRAAGFTALPWVRQAVRAALGIEMFPGTLNLRLEEPASMRAWDRVRSGPGIGLAAPDGVNCDARCFPVTLAGHLPAAVIIPEVAGYPAGQVEVVAALSLRRHLQLRDGDTLELASAELHGIRAAVFDVDGTLVNSIEGMWLAASRAAALYGFSVPADAVRRSLNYGDSLWEAIIPPEARGDAELPSILRMETMRHWPRVLADSVDVMAGLAATLEHLRGAGMRLAIYTGSRGESFLPLERAGLMRCFDPVVTASDVARPKPHPEGLLLCLERLGCAAAEAVYVGDSRHDVEAGRAAGMFTVGVLTGAADSALLSAAGASRLAASHAGLPDLLLPAGGAEAVR